MNWLDNLKLGYGGTREEMQRLLNKAEEITGIKYDISSFADITEAIHVIQTEMGITGTTALEAEATISGSLKMVKASWDNLVTGIADSNADFDKLLSNFVNSVNSLAGNLLPVIIKALSGAGELISKLLQQIVGVLPQILQDAVPSLLNSALELVNAIVLGLETNAEAIILAALELVFALVRGINDSLPTLVPAIVNIILTISSTLLDHSGELVVVALQLVLALTQGIILALPQLIEQAPVLVSSFYQALIDNLPLLIEVGAQIIFQLIKGIASTLWMILTQTIPNMIISMYDTFNSLIFKFGEIGVNLIRLLWNGITSTWNWVLSNVPSLMNQAYNRFISNSPEFVQVGARIIEGIWQGISQRWSWLTNKVSEVARSLVTAAKSALGIQSPSKEFMKIGQFSGQGFAIGFEEEANGIMATALSNVMGNIKASLFNDFAGGKTTSNTYTQNIQFNQSMQSPDEIARAIRLQNTYGLAGEY